MYVIYGLEDKRVPEIFYVGMTDNVYARFAQHLQCDGSNSAKDARILDMKANNVMVGMIELQRVEGFELARARESYWLQHYYQLGVPLTNQAIPLVQNEPIALKPAQIRLGPRMTLDEQRFYVRQLADTGISHSAIYAMVEKYIPREMVKFLLREYKRHEPDNAGPLTEVNGVTIEDFDRKLEMMIALLAENQDEQFRQIWHVSPGPGREYRRAKAERSIIAQHMQSLYRKDA